MKFTQLLSAVILIFLGGISLTAQENIKTFDFKKGEVLEILLLTTKPDVAELFDDYKKTFFPFGLKMSYQPMPGFRIASYTQGNHHPTSFLFSKWDNITKREAFLAQIENDVPDFHERRRAIWSIFDLTYYEMTKDISFQIDKSKVNVVTAYWEKNPAKFAKFKKTFLKKSKKSNGRTIVELSNGKSPFGYYYQPEYLVITEWDSKAEFDAFYQKNIKMDHDGVKHVNQFLLK